MSIHGPEAEARHKERRRVMTERAVSTVKLIVAELQARGYASAPLDKGDMWALAGIRSVVGVRDIRLGIEGQQSGAPYSRYDTGVLRLWMKAGWETTRQFPEPKKGFDIVKLVNMFVAEIEGQKKREAETDKLEATKTARERVLYKLCAELGVGDPPVHVHYKSARFQAELDFEDEDTLRALLIFIREHRDKL